MRSLRLYGRMIGLSVRAQWQYKASLLMMTLGQFANVVIEYFGVAALFQRFGAFGEWSLTEVSLFYAMAHMAFAISEATMRGFISLSALVRSGEFDCLLLRPRSTVLMLLGHDFQILRMGRFLQGLLIFIGSYCALPFAWNALEWSLFVCALLGGACLFAGLFVIRAIVSFRTIEGVEAFNIVTYGGTQMAQYPISAYKGFVKTFFLYILPLSALNYLPASALLHKGYLPAWLAWGSPLIGVGFFGVSLLAWRYSLRWYQSAGG